MVQRLHKDKKRDDIKSNQASQRAYVFAVGRRKEAVARVRLYQPTNGKVLIYGQEYERGDVIINGKPFASYFRFFAYNPYFKDFFDLTNAREKFVFSIKVEGGGLKGQLEAVLHGMARTLDAFDKGTYRVLLKPKGYLTRDARVRERRKVGTGGKARRKKQSPKR